MKRWTYLEIKNKVLRDLDLEDETFISAAEFMDYVNQAIDFVENQIHTIYEDYFLVYDTLNLVGGTQKYALPTDIFANKIRGILYNDGSKKYVIKRMKRIHNSMYTQGNEQFYQYILVNDATDGYRMMFFPTPSASETSHITRWYLRNATRMVDNTSICDIPEFTSFVIAKTKALCKQKENSGVPVNEMELMVDLEQKNMLETLSSMTDDEDTEVQMDLSFYRDFDSDGTVGGNW